MLDTLKTYLAGFLLAVIVGLSISCYLLYTSNNKLRDDLNTNKALLESARSLTKQVTKNSDINNDINTTIDIGTNKLNGEYGKITDDLTADYQKYLTAKCDKPHDKEPTTPTGNTDIEQTIRKRYIESTWKVYCQNEKQDTRCLP